MTTKEDLVVQYSEESKKRFVTLNIPIDNDGIGRVIFEASGYLEAVILPKMMVSFPSVRIYPVDLEYLAFDLKEQTETRVFFPRVQMHDVNGKVVDYFDKIYLSGSIVVEINNAVPESDFQIILVI